MMVHFDRVSWGLLVSKPLTVVADVWKDVVVDPAHEGEHAVTFCRIHFVRTPAPNSGPLLLVVRSVISKDEAGMSPVRAMLESHLNGRVAFVSKDSVGLATVEDLPPFPGELLAAAVGVSKASGSWDESKPIVVQVSDASFDVYPSFEDGAWRAEVNRTGSS